MVHEQIRTARIQNGLTQIEMAKRVHVCRKTYQDIESGNVSPKCSTLARIAEVSGQPVAWFFPRAVVTEHDIYIEQLRKLPVAKLKQLTELFSEV